jgi:hypothetical protein
MIDNHRLKRTVTNPKTQMIFMMAPHLLIKTKNHQFITSQT